MEKNRLEAFSDGVLAIIITIMVLEMKVPHGASLEDLRPIVPIFLSYLLSFVYVGIYWNNHHHLIKATRRINAAIMWANLHLLFWLSLLPFTTGWMGENHFSGVPLALYGSVLLGSALAYYVLQRLVVAAEGPGSALARSIGSDLKGKASPILYAVGIVLSLLVPALGGAVYVFVALAWLIPDRRISRVVHEGEAKAVD